MPNPSARKGFAMPFGTLDTYDTANDIAQPALLFSREVSVALQDVRLAFDPNEPVKDIRAATGIAGHVRK